MKSCSFVLLIRSFVIVVSVVQLWIQFGCFIIDDDTSIFIWNGRIVFFTFILSFFFPSKIISYLFWIRGFSWKKILFDCSLLRCKYFQINWIARLGFFHALHNTHSPFHSGHFAVYIHFKHYHFFRLPFHFRSFCYS